MEQLRNEIITVILHIEQYLRLLVISRYEEADQYISIVTELLNGLIPKIIKTCGASEAKNESDSMLWVMRLKCIVDAMGTEDDFLKIDAFDDMAELLRYYNNCLETEDE